MHFYVVEMLKQQQQKIDIFWLFNFLLLEIMMKKNKNFKRLTLY